MYEDGDYEAGNLEDHLKRCFPDSNYTKENVVGNNNIDFIYEMFEKTHTIEKSMNKQGFLIIEPIGNSGE